MSSERQAANVAAHSSGENPAEGPVSDGGERLIVVSNPKPNPSGETLGVGGSNPSPSTTLHVADATPEWLANHMAQLIGVRSGMRVLEPSAGHGALAIAARKLGAHVMCIELNQERVDVLRGLGFATLHHDFLRVGTPANMDRVIMCPPRDAFPHIQRALSWLAKDGRLIALVRRDTVGINLLYARSSMMIESEDFIWAGEPVPAGLLIMEAADATPDL